MIGSLLVPLLLLWTCFCHQTAAQPRNILQIAAFFRYDDDESGLEQAFYQAIIAANRFLTRVQLRGRILRLPLNSHVAITEVCGLFKDVGVAAVIEAWSASPTENVHSVCDLKNIPHVEIGWRLQSAVDFFWINMSPPFRSIAQATLQLALKLRWPSFIYLYDTEEYDGAARAQIFSDVFTSSTAWRGNITIKQLRGVNGDYKSTLKEVRRRNEKHYVIQCHHRRIWKFLNDSQYLNMLTQYSHFHFISLEIGLLDVADFGSFGANITGFAITDAANSSKQLALEKLQRSRQFTINRKSRAAERKRKRKRKRKRSKRSTSNWKLVPSEIALLYDAVIFLARGLQNLTDTANRTILQARLDCSNDETWNEGSTLVSYLKLVELDGLSGLIRLDTKGTRTDFKLHLLEICTDEIKKIGTYDDSIGELNMTKPASEVLQEAIDFLRNKTMRVTTLLTAPFTLFNDRSPDGKILTGNDRFSGFCIDLLRELARRLNFSFEINVVPDNSFGSQTGRTTWNGLVGQLIEKEADMAVAPLTITFLREEVIDFTKPFMNLGLSILYRRPHPDDPDIFGFLKPLASGVWSSMLAAYFTVSIILFLVARFTPYEWHPFVFGGRKEVDEDQDVVVNQFNLLNSFWFTVGSLMQQGCDITPRAISTRIISVAWWFFILIMISSYTANLAAFLTVERMKSPIETAEDLANQNKIVYGSLYNGATYNFFKDSNIDLYKRMWSQMNNFKVNAFVNETEAGIERVKNENYAFILESTWLEYYSSRNCELMQVGSLLDSKGYGIGLPRDSKIKDLLSDMILKLQDEQFLVERKDYWWKKTSHVRCSRADDKMKDANQLTVQHVGGIFIVLVIGLVISMVVAFLEYCWYARKVQVIPEGNLCHMMCKEFCMATKLLSTGRRITPSERWHRDSVKIEMRKRRKSSSVPPKVCRYESLEPYWEEPNRGYADQQSRTNTSTSTNLYVAPPLRRSFTPHLLASRRKLQHSFSVPILQFGI